MSLLVKAADVKDGAAIVQLQGGKMSTKFVYGKYCNIMVATRAGGYHSKPHAHDAEQINYVVEGEVWVFVNGTGFLAETGDFFRIPRNAVHWAWNRSTKPCTIVEVHAPPVDPMRRLNAVGLFDADEEPDTRLAVSNVNIAAEVSAIEAAVLGSALTAETVESAE